MINIDFSGAGSGISMDTFTVSARRPGELPREVSGAHMAVKETGGMGYPLAGCCIEPHPFCNPDQHKITVSCPTGSRNYCIRLFSIASVVLLHRPKLD